MLFDDVHSEKDLDRLKRSVVRDDRWYARILKIRDAMQYPRDGVTIWKKLEPYDGMQRRKMPSNAEMIALYNELIHEGVQKSDPQVEEILKKIKVRSNSGVAVVSVLTKPYACPGRCIYCPTEKNMPKSYLSKEPAAARALANKFDPYAQVENRLRALKMNGHPTDKLEVIVIGGTWSHYHEVYQEEYIAELFRAANNWGRRAGSQIVKKSRTLVELQRINERAQCRIVGLSVETRPDHITKDELIRMRYLGVTKVEVGVQHLEDDILKFNQRDMTREVIAESTERMREAGFKVVYHMMPNLPGSNPSKDIHMFEELFSGEDFHPDMLKIYPCMVLKRSYLYKMWTRGEFQAYSEEELIRVMIEAKKHVPPYVRIIRVYRDIPASYIIAGSKTSNLRQVIERDQKAKGWKCKCIRCREVRSRTIDPSSYTLHQLEYRTRRGLEIFLSFENDADDTIAAFLRLRLPDRDKAGVHLLPGLSNAALIRELHTYGKMARFGDEGSQSQHRGFGKQLMEVAEQRARAAGYGTMAVISGVGVRGYYRKLGYRLNQTYMIKNISSLT